MSDKQLPLAERVVARAAECVGMREKGGPNKGPPIERFAGGREEPWCGHAVATLFREEGRPLPGDISPSRKQHNPIARVATMWARLIEAGWQVEGPPKPGDIVVWETRDGSDAGSGMHVGIVSAVKGDIVQSIDGNWGNKVGRRSFRADDHRIAGFARVPELPPDAG
jgi:hypothetical protein